jgi:hypothetical protein
MKDDEKLTRIKLELIIGTAAQAELKNRCYIELQGSCREENPNMDTKICWYTRDGFVPEGSIDEKELLGEASLEEKYSQLMSFANEKFSEKVYRIKMRVEKEE